jgi:lysozyme family protein
MANFEHADRFRRQVEGIYSNESTDRGGETVFGLCYRDFKHLIGFWQAVAAHKAIANGDSGILKARLKADQVLQSRAAEAFKKAFWDPFNLDDMPDQDLAEEVYEQATNMGGRVAATNLQEALNLCNTRLGPNGPVQLWPDLALDGQIGPATHQALQACHAGGRLRAVMDVINSLQAEDYINIARRSPTQRVYIPGWIGQRVKVGKA